MSAGSSSPLHISTFPAPPATRLGMPSGHRPPWVTVAASAMAMVVLPCPGAPAKMCSLPRANQLGQSQRIGSGFRSVPCASTTAAGWRFGLSALPWWGWWGACANGGNASLGRVLIGALGAFWCAVAWYRAKSCAAAVGMGTASSAARALAMVCSLSFIGTSRLFSESAQQRLKRLRGHFRLGLCH